MCKDNFTLTDAYGIKLTILVNNEDTILMFTEDGVRSKILLTHEETLWVTSQMLRNSSVHEDPVVTVNSVSKEKYHFTDGYGSYEWGVTFHSLTKSPTLFLNLDDTQRLRRWFVRYAALNC